eukprot:2441578-Heterocapsa_arctica.AAC.1
MSELSPAARTGAARCRSAADSRPGQGREVLQLQGGHLQAALSRAATPEEEANQCPTIPTIIGNRIDTDLPKVPLDNPSPV